MEPGTPGFDESRANGDRTMDTLRLRSRAVPGRSDERSVIRLEGLGASGMSDMSQAPRVRLQGHFTLQVGLAEGVTRRPTRASGDAPGRMTLRESDLPGAGAGAGARHGPGSAATGPACRGAGSEAQRRLYPHIVPRLGAGALAACRIERHRKVGVEQPPSPAAHCAPAFAAERQCEVGGQQSAVVR